MEIRESYESPALDVVEMEMEGIICGSNENIGVEDGNGAFN